MGERNVQTKAFISQNERFADLCNFYLFDGKEVVRAEDLYEQDVTELALPYVEDNMETTERIRDVLKGCAIKSTEDTTYLIVGIENQSDIHYAMVIRNMLYDALNYTKQVNIITQEHRKKKDLRGEEFLSGFSKEDKLIPVITITVYWNEGKWDGPRSLYEMLRVKHLEVLRYVSDYRMNLLVPNEIRDFEKFRTELGGVMELLSCAHASDKLRKLIETKYDKGLYMGREEVQLLNACINLKLPVPEKGEKVEVCKGMLELLEEEKNIGISQGLSQGVDRGREEGEDMLSRLILHLADLNRMEDIVRVASDKQYRKEMFVQFGIQ